jgi:non-ribosomal peptide synthetase component E (peptide arylation enzyme)
LDIRRQTVGVPISPLDEVKLLDPGTETAVEPGQQGEMCCRGAYTIRGYYNAPERNATAFTSDGFYRTGDIMVEVRSPEGQRFFALADRLKDVISRGGEKINAGEVEELLLRHPAIQQAAVVAMPDPVLGERSCAFVVLEPGTAPPVDVAAVAAFLEDLGVAKFKFPERIEIREELPMTSVTKVKKAELRAEIARIVTAEQQR